MPSPQPLFKIQGDRLEVRQGENTVSLDRTRVESVHLQSGKLTVRYRERGEIVLDCTTADAAELKLLLQTLQTQRDRNIELARRRREQDSTSNLPSMY